MAHKQGGGGGGGGTRRRKGLEFFVLLHFE